MKKRKIVIFGLIFLFFLLLFIFKIKNEMTDFEVCYKAGQRILAGENLYRLSDGHEQFKYLPFSAYLFVPFVLLPLPIAKAIWYFIVLFTYFLSLYLSYYLLPEKRKKAWVLIFLTFLILLKFYGRELQLGQINCLIIFLLLLMLIKIFENKEILSGFLWAFTLPIKLYALIFLPYFVIRKKFKVILWGSIFFLIILLLPSIQYGIKGNIKLLTTWKYNLSITTPPLLGVYDNASIYALLIKWFDGKEIFIKILLVLIVSLLAFLVIYVIKVGIKKKLEKSEVLESSILFILIPLLSPLGWYYNYLYSILGIMILINYFKLFPRFLKYLLILNLFLIGGTLYEILGKEFFRLYTRLSIVTINYLSTIGFLVYLRFKKFI
mgnify:CR=1 FL=1